MMRHQPGRAQAAATEMREMDRHIERHLADRHLMERHLDQHGDDMTGLFAFDVHALWTTIMRQKFAIAAIMGAALALGVISLLVTARIYEAHSSVKIDQQVAKVLGTEENEPLASGIYAERFLQTEIDIMNSRMLAQRVAQGLGLMAKDDFLTQMGVSTLFRDKGETRQERILNTLQKNLVTELKRNSRIVVIGFRSRDPALAARVANAYADEFIKNNVQKKFQTSDYSLRFLKEQLTVAKGRLETSEKDLIAYARSSHLIDASAGAKGQGATTGPKSLVTANLVELNDRFAAAEALSSQAQQRWEQANHAPLMTLPEVLSNDAVSKLLARRAELDGSLNEMLARLKPDHPSVIQAKAQLTQIDQQIRTLAESIRSSIFNQYAVAARQRNALAGQVANLKTETLSEQDRSIRYNILNREVDTNRQLYESLLQRFKEVSSQSGVASNNITLVDNAEPPVKHSFPKTTTNMGLALSLGILLSWLYLLLSERINNVLREPHDVETRFGVPLLGVVPKDHEVEVRKALDNPKSPVSEAYHSIRNSLQLSYTGGMPKTLVVTSSAKSEGKSTTCYALAHDFASIGKRVLLVDADLRRPSLHTFFDIERTDEGLSSVLAGICAPEAAIVESKIPNISFLPAGPLAPNPAALFAGDMLRNLVEQMEQAYDLILLDAPPVLALADAPTLAIIGGGTIFVTEADSTNFVVGKRALARLSDVGANIVGCIVTKFRNHNKNNSYYYSYSYE